MLTLLQILATVSTLSSNYLAGKYQWGWWISLLANIIWIIFTISTRQWWLLGMSVAMAIVAIRNALLKRTT